MARKAFKPYDLHSVWFNDQEKIEYENWISDRTLDILDCLLELQENGFKTSISSDGAKGTPLISISIKPRTQKDAGRVFLYRHSDLEKCIRIAYYHFTVVSQFGQKLLEEDSTLDW